MSRQLMVLVFLFHSATIVHAQLPTGMPATLDTMRIVDGNKKMADAINERETEASRLRLMEGQGKVTPHCSRECTTLTCGKLRLPNRDGIFFRHEDPLIGTVSIFCKDGRLFEKCRTCIGRLARKHRDHTARSLRY